MLKWTEPPPLMHLTDDEHVVFATPNGLIPVRVRVYRAANTRPIVLATPDAKRSAAAHAGRIATYAHHCLLKGHPFLYADYCPEDGWRFVTFAQIRHHYVAPEASKVKRGDLEWALGQPV